MPTTEIGAFHWIPGAAEITSNPFETAVDAAPQPAIPDPF